MLFRLLPVPLCYVAFSACERSAKSQTLKVHPVASKTLTQKIPICCPRTPRWRFLFFNQFLPEYSDVNIPRSKWTNPWSSSHTPQPYLFSAAEFLRHTQSLSLIFSAPWISTHSSPHTHVCVLRLSSAVSRCLADQETTPVIQLTLSAPRAEQ